MSGVIYHEHMVAVLAKDGALIAQEMTADGAHLFHMSVGISGEIGELLEAFDKVFTHGVKDLDRVNVVEELGDAEFYIAGFRQGIGISREQTLLTIATPLVGENSLISMSNGVSISASNLLDTVKKGVIYRKDVGEDVFIDRLSQLERYLHRIRLIVGVTREETIEANIAKLSVRYDGFEYSDESAQTRADKADGE